MKLIAISLSFLFPLLALSAESYEIHNPVGPEVLKERIRASYGFLSQREPALNTTEYAIIDKFLPYLEVDPAFAIEMIEGLTTNNPNLTASFNLTLGNLYFQTGDLTASRKSYAKAVDKFPDYLRAWKAIGLLEMHEQNFEAAKKSLGKAVTLGDSDPDTFGLIAYAFYIEQDYLAALSAYSHALLFEPESEDWIQGKIACLLKLEDYRSARTILESITRKHPREAKHWTVLANVYLHLDAPLKAAAVLEYLRQEGISNPEHSSLLTSIYLGNDLPELATNVLLQQLESGETPNPKKLVACLLALSNSGLGELAESLMANAQSQAPLNDPKYQYALLRYQGEAAMKNDQHAAALNYLKEALEQADDRGPVLLQLGINQHLAGETTDAVRYLEEASIFPAVRLSALTTLGQVMIAQGEFQAAMDHLQTAIDEGADSRSQELYDRALHAARKQDFDRRAFQAIKQY